MSLKVFINRSLKKLLIFIFVIISFISYSQSTTWKGTESPLWSNPNNWTNGVPNSNTEVVIPWLSSSVNQPIIDINITFRKLTMNANPNILKINDNIEVTVKDYIKIGNTATLDVANGILNVEGNVSTGSNIRIGNGTINFYKNFSFTGGGLIVNENGIINIGNSSSDFYLGGSNTIKIINGVINIHGSATFSGSGSFDAGNSNVNIYGDVTVSGSGKLNLESGNVYIEGDVTATGSGIIDAGSSEIVMAGETWQISNGALFNYGTSTVVFANSNVILMGGGGVTLLEFYNVIIDTNTMVNSNTNVLIFNNLYVNNDANLDITDGLTLNVVGLVVGDNYVNTDHPYIISMNYDSKLGTISLVFNLALDPVSAQTASNYRLEDEYGTVVSYFKSAVLKPAPNDNIVTLFFDYSSDKSSNPEQKFLEPEQSYYLIANDIYSASNSSLSSDHIKLLYDGFLNDDPSPLPISLLSFYANQLEENILIEWSTATETNNDYFTIEKSIDNLNNWEILSYIQGNGNSNRILNYNFVDDNPVDGVQYYRLKQTDYDGKFEYFNIVAVNYIPSNDIQVKIYPSPAQNYLSVLTQGFFGNTNVQIFDLSGKKVIDVNNSGSDIAELDISNLISGVYIVKIISGNANQQIKLIKN